jgi:hypothetical protein
MQRAMADREQRAAYEDELAWSADALGDEAAYPQR